MKEQSFQKKVAFVLMTLTNMYREGSIGFLKKTCRFRGKFFYLIQKGAKKS
jgi:hypothetical protein